MKRFNQFILVEAAKERFPVNKGHTYEFVLAAAMVSRFTDRYDDGTPMEITVSSVNATMAGYFKGDVVWEVEEGDGIDTVEFVGTGLPPGVLSVLSVERWRNSETVQMMVDKAIIAVNDNSTLTDLSTEVIMNGVPDTVKVVCGGTVGQMSTKSDVDLYVNNDEIRKAGFSIKWGGVGQVAQWAGVDLAKNIDDGFFSFGMSVREFLGPVKAAFQDPNFIGVYKTRKDLQVEKDKAIIFGAVNGVFTKIGRKFKEIWFDDPKNVETLTTGLLKAAKGKEEDVELVKNGFTYNKVTFDALAKGISNSARDSKTNIRWLVIVEDGNPKVQLWIDNLKIFQVRCRYDADPDKTKSFYKVRFRLYVELDKGAIEIVKKVRASERMIKTPKRGRR
jgi:hypothetical protein